MAFPITRLRRLRQTEPLRSMVRETRLSPESFVYPMFVCPGEGVRKEVRSMPGVFNLSVDEAVKEAQQTHSLGVPAVILFGLPEKKDEVANGRLGRRWNRAAGGTRHQAGSSEARSSWAMFACASTCRTAIAEWFALYTNRSRWARPRPRL